MASATLTTGLVSLFAVPFFHISLYAINRFRNPALQESAFAQTATSYYEYSAYQSQYNATEYESNQCCHSFRQNYGNTKIFIGMNSLFAFMTIGFGAVAQLNQSADIGFACTAATISAIAMLAPLFFDEPYAPSVRGFFSCGRQDTFVARLSSDQSQYDRSSLLPS